MAAAVNGPSPAPLDVPVANMLPLDVAVMSNLN
jgi:hypothetical protein